MGISHMEYNFLATACGKGVLPQHGDVLEIGEARSFVPLREVLYDRRIGVDSARVQQIFDDSIAYSESVKGDDRYHELVGFYVAKKIYSVLFKYNSITSIDYSGSDAAIKVDLNEPFSLGRQFNVCLNCGTTEHIFNQYQAYRTIHEHTAVGGVMIHWQPAYGLSHVNHGMFLPQPGMFFDLADANDYEVAYAALANDHKVLEITSPWLDAAVLEKNLGTSEIHILTVLRKTGDAPFKAPQQYQSRLDKNLLAHSWEKIQDQIRT